MGELLDVSRLLLRCRARLADHTVGGWEDTEVLWIAPTAGRVLVNCPADVPAEVGAGHKDKDEFAPARRKPATPAAVPRLHNNRTPLR